MRGTIVSSVCAVLFVVGCSEPEEGFVERLDSPDATPDPVDDPGPEPGPEPILPPLFTDVTTTAGLDWYAPEPTSEQGPLRRFAGGGAVAADLDGDDVVDLLLTAVDGPNALYLGLGDGSFQPRADSGLEVGDWTFGAAAADLDGDGLREVLMYDAHQLRVFENLGGGDFAEQPPALTLGPEEWVVGGGFVDYDGDGHVDGYVVVQGDWELGEPPSAGAEDRLLGGQPGLQFEDRTHLLGEREQRVGQGFAVTWLDVDHDGDLDAYVANEKGTSLVPNQLFVQKDGGFLEESERFGLDLAMDGMGLATADLGHDGAPEIAITDTDFNLELVRLEDGFAVEIADACPAAGPEFYASWATQLEDFDNDGEADLLTAWGQFESDGDPGRVTLSRWGGDAFEDLTPQLPDLLDPTWRSVLPVDLNADGQLDWVQTRLVGAPVVILGRPTGAQWLAVELEGPEGNRDGLGARVTVIAGGVERSRWLGAGIAGAHSSTEPVLHFGLGEVAEVEAVRVDWPDGTTSLIPTPEPARRLVVSKG